MSPPEWSRAEIREGMMRMLASRAEIRRGGEHAIGWKLAFGAPHWLERFELSGPLVGYLPASGLRPSGATVPVRGWVRPVAEPEIAVHLGGDVDPDRPAEAVAAVGAAIELADVHSPPEDLEEVVAGNVFHRAVVLGEADQARAGLVLEGLRATVTLDGAEIADTTDLVSLTGEPGDILAHAARLLAAAGERMSAGDVVILGSIVPPVALGPGEEVRFELAPLPPVTVRV